VHAHALRAFLALRAGHGHGPAAEIMRCVNRGDAESAYRLIDTAHVDLLTERETHAEAASALGALSAVTPAPSGGPLSVGELAHRLGVHRATLRAWEAEGILRPGRDRATGYRTYGPDCVRDAEIARQLRRGGYPLTRIARFVDSVREAGGTDELRVFLGTWQDRLGARSRNLLTGAARLDAYLALIEKADPAASRR